MNNTMRYALLGFLILIVSACVDPYDYLYEDNSEPKIVIDGYLSNEQGVHEIRVARVTRLGEYNGVEYDYVEDASVSIIDSDGSKIDFSHDSIGIYLSAPEVRAQPEKSYKVRVTLDDDKVYESSFEKLPETQENDIGLSYKLDTRDIIVNGSVQNEQGVSVEAKIVKGGENKFYRWDVNHYFIIEADEGPDFTLQNQRYETDTALRFCFIKDFVEQEVYLHKDIGLNEIGASYKQEIEFIRISPKFEYVFVIEAKQLIIPVHAYNYWKQIKDLAQNSGGLFDSAPFPITGNIKRVDARANKDDGQLGFFGVYNSSIDRQFVTQSSLGIKREFAPCTAPVSPLPEGIPAPSQCKDCRLYEFLKNYENSPPSWWKY